MEWDAGAVEAHGDCRGAEIRAGKCKRPTVGNEVVRDIAGIRPSGEIFWRGGFEISNDPDGICLGLARTGGHIASAHGLRHGVEQPAAVADGCVVRSIVLHVGIHRTGAMGAVGDIGFAGGFGGICRVVGPPSWRIMLDVAVCRKHERGLLALRVQGIIQSDIGGQPAEGAVEIDAAQDIGFEGRTRRASRADGDIASPLPVGGVIFRGVVDRVVEGEDIAAVRSVHSKARRGRRGCGSRSPCIQPDCKKQA